MFYIIRKIILNLQYFKNNNKTRTNFPRCIFFLRYRIVVVQSSWIYVSHKGCFYNYKIPEQVVIIYSLSFLLLSLNCRWCKTRAPFPKVRDLPCYHGVFDFPPLVRSHVTTTLFSFVSQSLSTLPRHRKPVPVHVTTTP